MEEDRRRYQTFTMRMDRETRRKLDDLCKIEHRSKANMISVLIARARALYAKGRE